MLVNATSPLDAHVRLVDEAVAEVRARSEVTPLVGIVLGTGLGALVEEVDTHVEISYEALPGFESPTVETHAGSLILGTLGGTPVAVMRGRFHRYEGYTLQQVTLPIRVLRMLGAETLVVSGICGCMNPEWRERDLVVLDDHINLLGDSPLIGPNHEAWGPRFPDMSEPYDRALQRMARDAATELGLPVRTGVYAAVTGPNLETRAEYAMLRAVGADVVGMSTVPEVIVARHMSMRVLGLSIVTDMCLPGDLEPVDVNKIIQNAIGAEPGLTRVIAQVVGQL